jgi:ankyrin repeat protein
MTDPEAGDAVAFAHRMFDLAREGSELLPGLVDSGVPANLTDATGNTLLMLAAYHGHARLTGQLAERGADVNAVNDRGQTPLAGAVFKDTRDVVVVLLDAGADPDLGSPSARETAAFFEKPQILALFEGP